METVIKLFTLGYLEYGAGCLRGKGNSGILEMSVFSARPGHYPAFVNNLDSICNPLIRQVFARE